MEWTDEAEVIVVGYGGAGAVTAIAAADAGAKVLLVEKQPPDTPQSTNHTPSTRMSGGGFLCPADAEKATQYFLAMRRIANETVDEEVEATMRLLVERMTHTVEWMESIGGVVGGKESMSPVVAQSDMKIGASGSGAAASHDADFPELPGADSLRTYWMQKSDEYRHGAAFFKTLTNAVEKRNIPVLWGAAGKHLVMEDGAARGILCEKDGQKIAIKATRGIALTCGGFEYNDFMKENYLRPNPIQFYGNPANTGDGIVMSQEAGAAMWHMNCISYRVTMKFPEHPIAFGLQHHSQMSIIVDKHGKRFSNERFKAHAFGYELAAYDCYAMCYPRVPCYWIFDEKRRQLGPLASQHGACNPPAGIKGAIHYTWSQDNSTEIDRGWIWKADTLEELADKIAADPDNNGLMKREVFRATVERYNQLCREGKDTDFGRPKGSLGPLQDAPYYAVKLWPGGPNTQGGPMRNLKCQVIRSDRTPVPRLYACGELGSYFGMLYNGGANLAENIAMGSLTGENVAAEELWA